MKVLLDEKEYDLGQLTIDQYKNVGNRNNMDDSEFVSFITGIPLDEVRQATIPQISFVAKAINMWVQNTSNKQPLKKVIKYGDEILGLTTPSTMSWGEFTDLEIISSQKNINLNHIAAVLYRPCETYNAEDDTYKIVKYDYEQCLERSKDMGDFPLGDILSATFFFMTYAKQLTSKENSYMVNKRKMMTELLHQMKEQSKKNLKT